MFRSAAASSVILPKCSTGIARRWNAVVANGSKDREAQLHRVSPENRSVLPMRCCQPQAFKSLVPVTTVVPVVHQDQSALKLPVASVL
jgi:hypothetical protein